MTTDVVSQDRTKLHITLNLTDLPPELIEIKKMSM